MKKTYDFEITPTQVLTFFIAAFIALIFFTLTGHAQRPTALTEQCSGQPQTIRNQIFTGTDGNIHLKPCPGKAVLINGNPLGAGGIFSNGSILFQHLNSGMISNDVTLSSDSGVKLPTEHAVKSYVDAVTGFVTLSSVRRVNFNGTAAPVAGWTGSTGSEYFSDLTVFGYGHNTGDTFDPNGQTNLVAEGLYRTFFYWLGAHSRTMTVPGLTNGQIYIVRIHSWKPSSLNNTTQTFTANINGGANTTFTSLPNKALVKDITFTASGGTAQLNLASPASGDGLFISAIEVFAQTVTGSNTIASDSLLGKVKLSTPPDDASNPIALGINDPILKGSDDAISTSAHSTFAAAHAAAVAAGKALAINAPVTFTTNTTITANTIVKNGIKLTANSGVTVTIAGEFHAPIDSVFLGAGKFDFQTAKTRRLIPEWWGATGRDSTDDAAAILATIAAFGLNAAGGVNGGTIYFPSTGYRFATPLDLTRVTNIRFQGNESGWNGGSDTLTYTGSASPAIILNATRGLSFDRMHFNAGASLTGVFIQGGYSGDYGDTNNNKFENCSFYSPTTTATLMTLDRVISSQVRDSNFIGGAIGIVGSVTSNDSNVIIIEGNHFKSNTQAAIKSIGQWWTVINNTFSGGSAAGYAVTTDDAQTFTSRALYFANNYFETHKGFGVLEVPVTGGLIKVKTNGAVFSGNGFTAGGTTGATVELVTSRGVTFIGNRFEGATTLTGITGSGNVSGVSINGNDFIGTTPVGGLVTAAYSATGNIGLGDKLQTAIHTGNAVTSQTDIGLTFGNKDTTLGGANTLGQIAVLDGSITGYTHRSLGYFAPSTNNAPHHFFVHNGTSWLSRFSIQNGDSYSQNNLLFFADNTKNIGEAAAFRPANIFAGTSIVAPLFTSSAAAGAGSDTAYNASSWDASLVLPTKNAVRDQIETLQPKNTGFTTCSVPFIASGGLLAQNNAQLCWDNANARFGLLTNSPLYTLSIGTNKGFAQYTSSSSNDAIKVLNSGGGATFGVQNNSGSGFSGIEYFDNSGNAAVFTGFRNGGTGEFRFNNVATNGFITLKINGTDRFVVLNNGNIQLSASSDTGERLQIGGNGYFSGQLSAGQKALTDSATIAINFNDGNTQTVTLGGNRTITFSNAKAGAKYTLFLKQDSVGSRTVSFPAISWSGGNAPTLTTAPNKTDIITIWFDGTTYYGKVDLNF